MSTPQTPSPLPDPEENGTNSNSHSANSAGDPLEPDAIYRPGEGPHSRRSFSTPGGNSFTAPGGNSFIMVGTHGSRFLIGAGILATLLGIGVAVWPHAGITIFAWAVGIVGLSIGASIIYATAVARRIPVVSGMGILTGIVFILAAIAVIISPQTFGVFIMIMVGLLSLMQGIITLSSGRYLSRGNSSSYFTITGILSIVLGLVFIFAPMTSLYSMTIFLGILLAAFGILVTTGGIRAGRFVKTRLG